MIGLPAFLYNVLSFYSGLAQTVTLRNKCIKNIMNNRDDWKKTGRLLRNSTTWLIKKNERDENRIIFSKYSSQSELVSFLLFLENSNEKEKENRCFVSSSARHLGNQR